MKKAVIPDIKIWCLPDDPEKKLKKLLKQIVDVAISIPELGVKSEADILVLFPEDKMKFGLGDEILVEISISSDHSVSTKNRLVAKIGAVISALYPNSRINCKTITFDPKKEAFWTSYV